MRRSHELGVRMEKAEMIDKLKGWPKLKSCPFCGAIAELRIGKTVLVSCTRCTATTFQKLRDENSAVRNWNRRTQSAKDSK